MEVNKLESREVLTILFGMPVMITLIVLASIAVGHLVTTRSDRPTTVQVTAAPPKIEMKVPQAPAPTVTVAPANVDVKVPPVAPPTIMVSTPPAVVTVIDQNDSTAAVARTAKENPEYKPADTKVEPAKPEPKPTPPAKQPDAKPASRQSAAPVPENKVAPVAAENPSDAAEIADVPAPPAKTEQTFMAALRDEDINIDTLYRYAEKYIEAYCKKNALDPIAENKKWQDKWRRNLEQSITDQIDHDEQSYINRVVIAKRDCFDLEKATPEKAVEACRIMLRYRDGQLAWLKAMRDAATTENMKKTLAFLAAGPR